MPDPVTIHHLLQNIPITVSSLSIDRIAKITTGARNWIGDFFPPIKAVLHKPKIPRQPILCSREPIPYSNCVHL